MSLAHDVDVAVNLMEKDAERFVRAVNIEIFRSIIEATPVDTGRLRGNWLSSEGSPETSPSTRTDGSAAINEAAATVGKGFGLYWLTNNLPYAGVAEFGGWGTGPGATEKTTRDGYSVQAPYGMVRKQLARITEILRRHAR